MAGRMRRAEGLHCGWQMGGAAGVPDALIRDRIGEEKRPGSMSERPAGEACMMEGVFRQARQVAQELLDAAKLRPGQLMVVGCSSSEIMGQRIGKGSSLEAAQAVFEGLWPPLMDAGVYLAAQCCEHLNRSLVVERALADSRGYEIVNAVPQPHAGGSFAVTAYGRMKDPVLVECVRAEAGMDVGGTLIGMHLRPVAVPVRLSLNRIGEALLLCARTRPKYVGGARAVYLEM